MADDVAIDLDGPHQFVQFDVFAAGVGTLAGAGPSLTVGMSCRKIQSEAVGDPKGRLPGLARRHACTMRASTGVETGMNRSLCTSISDSTTPASNCTISACV